MHADNRCGAAGLQSERAVCGKVQQARGPPFAQTTRRAVAGPGLQSAQVVTPPPNVNGGLLHVPSLLYGVLRSARLYLVPKCDYIPGGHENHRG
jgi:hypothetical protein